MDRQELLDIYRRGEEPDSSCYEFIKTVNANEGIWKLGNNIFSLSTVDKHRPDRIEYLHSLGLRPEECSVWDQVIATGSQTMRNRFAVTPHFHIPRLKILVSAALPMSSHPPESSELIWKDKVRPDLYFNGRVVAKWSGGYLNYFNKFELSEFKVVVGGQIGKKLSRVNSVFLVTVTSKLKG